MKTFKKEMGSAVLGQVTVDQAIGGMRGIPVRDYTSLSICTLIGFSRACGIVGVVLGDITARC